MPLTRSSIAALLPWLSAIASGVILAFTCAPWNATELVWIWAWPLLAVLWFARSVRGSAKKGWWIGWTAGFAFFVTSNHWLWMVGKVAETFWAGLGACIFLNAYLACYFGLFGAFAATAGRWILTEPERSPKHDLFNQSFAVLRVAALNGAAWCGLEWIRGWLFTGFGWNGLGVALRDHLLLAQLADVIGLTGYSFILLFCNVIGFATVIRLGREFANRRRMRPHLDFAVGVALIIGLFIHGTFRLSHPIGETVDLRARILQLNIDLKDKWSDEIEVRQRVIYDYRDLTRAFVETSDYDLVLWPESAMPGHFTFPWVQKYLNDMILKGEDFYLLSGIEEGSFDGEEIYNSVFLLKGSTENYQNHRKVHLVPLGEYLPWRESFPIFEWILGRVITLDFTAGETTEPLILEKEGHRIGVAPLICFEDTVPRHARKFIRPGPQIFVNVTNDGWFYDSAEPMQHFHNALFRCIEMRRPMIRAANTGVSAFIDERGSVYDREDSSGFARILADEETGSTYIRGSLPGTVRVALDPPVTFYARHGDIFSAGLGGLALVYWLSLGLRRRFRKG